MSEKKEKKVDIAERRINIEEFLKVEVTNVIVTKRNEPNMKLMAQAFVDLMNQS
ncbi:hypothetical protein [Solibacillus sp. CAU 1738]|uniref:hypothetical protein n=1 Tax=Solibacillus sp. CAU 1738 TaxID=3140363 RepID=UPI0032618322